MQSQHSCFVSCELIFLLTYRRIEMTTGLLLTQSKDDIDGRADLYRLFIQERGLVNPLFDRIERSLAEQRVAADHAQLLDVAILTDDRRQFDGSGDARLTRDLRINRLRISDKLCRLHAAADVNGAAGLRGRLL